MTLYEAIAAARETGEAEKLWVHRCGQGCRLAGAYRVRGRVAVLLGSYRPPMWMRERYSLPRKVEGEAWFAGDQPEGEHAVGCKHGGQLVTITTEPRLIATEPVSAEAPS